MIAVALAVPAAAWYFIDRGESVEQEEVASDGGLALQGDPAASSVEERGQARVTTTFGLQTTVPDTVGFDEKTAAFTLEEGGFRVRVMGRKVSDSRDEGIVVQQLPRGGVTRRVNWIVTIVVGRLR